MWQNDRAWPSFVDVAREIEVLEAELKLGKMQDLFESLVNARREAGESEG